LKTNKKKLGEIMALGAVGELLLKGPHIFSIN